MCVCVCVRAHACVFPCFVLVLCGCAGWCLTQGGTQTKGVRKQMLNS